MARRKRILIVEDDAASRSVLAATLAGAYDIATATNGADGLALALGRPKPDLIVTDVMMPEMDGFEMVQHVRGEPDMVSLPVIFLSAGNASGDYKHAEDLKADNYLTKPLTSARLLDAVKSALERASDRDDS